MIDALLNIIYTILTWGYYLFAMCMFAAFVIYFIKEIRYGMSLKMYPKIPKHSKESKD